MVHAIQNRSEWTQKLAEAKQSNKLVVVDFTATWCPPCRFIAPFFTELSEKYPNVLFLKVDVDDLNDIASEYGVQAMPTFKFLKDGVVVDEVVGANKAELEKKVQQHMVVLNA